MNTIARYILNEILLENCVSYFMNGTFSKHLFHCYAESAPLLDDWVDLLGEFDQI
jgi:hypothetical protein